MKLTQYLTVAALLAASTPAAAIAVPVPRLASQELFRVCLDPDFGGECMGLAPHPDQCYNFNDFWSNQITSARTDFGPDHSCTLYEDSNCGVYGKSEIYLNRPARDLRLSNMDDVAKSYKCHLSPERVPVTPVVIIPVEE